jgi:hypothetical protein
MLVILAPNIGTGAVIGMGILISANIFTTVIPEV